MGGVYWAAMCPVRSQDSRVGRDRLNARAAHPGVPCSRSPPASRPATALILAANSSRRPATAASGSAAAASPARRRRRARSAFAPSTRRRTASECKWCRGRNPRGFAGTLTRPCGCGRAGAQRRRSRRRTLPCSSLSCATRRGGACCGRPGGPTSSDLCWRTRTPARPAPRARCPSAWKGLRRPRRRRRPRAPRRLPRRRRRGGEGGGGASAGAGGVVDSDSALMIKI